MSVAASDPSEKIRPELGTVQETMLIPLWARATESQQRSPILCDPKAVEICEAIDFDFAQFRRATMSRVGIALRTLQFDAWIKSFLADHPAGTVVEVGAGLSSRFERLDNGSVRWIDLDLPDSIALRRNFFDESPRRTMLASSVLDEQWLDVAAEAGGPWFVNIEAVLMYLDEPQIRDLFGTIASRLPGAMVAFDTLTSRGLRQQGRHEMKRFFEATFTWSIEDTRAIERWGDQFRCVDRVNLKHVAVRNLDRIPLRLKVISLAMSAFRRRAVNDYWLSLFCLNGQDSAIDG
ncbi:class I SAM-dependent methyltransferase [Stratiformator vulcanicus]|uniref:Leucine carboxyl methyltransferase n=1 Tax=Stratiformator vulcanicus TaxID=2527980 RepID=A0A517R5F8_9PLAN|nr:class I SAM-dependent methyltransferase [Stratiformator vulcanicus]QDT39128.1 Leucine carboxyl methyltransferase [Stratiformator vulcanicus]